MIKTTSFRSHLFLLVLIVAVLAIYARIFFYPFINFDDNFYVFGNPHLKNGLNWKGLQWALTADLLFDSAHVDYWQPVTAISRLIDVSLFDFWAGGHHLINLLLHIANVILLFNILLKVSKSFLSVLIVTSLFALHPVQVETVAWVTARKDLLSTFFILIASFKYLEWMEKPAAGKLFASIVFYALSLLSKPIFFLFPVGIALIKRNVRACFCFLPALILFFAASIFSNTGVKGRIFSLDWYSNSLAHFGFYIVKLFIPIRFGIYKPLSESEILLWSFVGFISSVVIFLIVVESFRKKQEPVWVGIVIFLITIATSIQIKVADRVLYAPQIGIWVAWVWALSKSINYKPKIYQTVFSISAFSIIFMLAVQSFQQVSFWKSTKTLFEHSNSLSKGHYIAKNVLANEYATTGDAPSAFRLYGEAIEENPNYMESYLNFGSLLIGQGQADQAIQFLERALSMNPNLAETHVLLGTAYIALQDLEKAEIAYTKAIQLKPDLLQALNNLGNISLRKGNLEEAIQRYKEAIQIDPDVVEPHNNLTVVYQAARLYDQAWKHYREVLRINPQYPGIYHRISKLFQEWGKPVEAQFYSQKT